MVDTVLTGITGGIGSGKSMVSRILRLKGYQVYDCDQRAKVLMDADLEFKNALCKNFGSDVVSDDGVIDRCRLASVLFSDQEKMDWMNKTVHAMVRADVAEWIKGSGAAVGVMYAMDDCKKPQAPLKLFIESAILKKAALDKICNRIWLVRAPEDIRMERIKSRSGLSTPQILERMRAQRKEYDNLPLCKLDIIENFEDHSLLMQIDNLLG